MEEACPNFRTQWFHAILGGLGMVNVGAGFGLSSVLLPQLQEESNEALRLTMDNGGALVYWFLIPGLLGSLSSGLISDLLGRRPVLVACQLFFSLSWIIMANCQDLTTLWLTRALMGYVDGAAFSVTAVYLNEISHASIRGGIVNLMNIGQNTGIVFIYTLGYFFNWRTFCCIESAICLVTFFLFLFWILETPFFLIRMSHDDKGKVVLQKFRGANYDISKELEEMIHHRKRNAASDQTTFKDKVKHAASTIFSKKFSRPFIIAITLSCLSDSSGIWNLVMYPVTILQESGTNVNPYLASIGIALMRTVLACFASIGLRMFSHKLLYSSMLLVVSVSFGLVATMDYIRPMVLASGNINGTIEAMELSGDLQGWLTKAALDWIPIICLFLALMANSIGPDAALKVLIGEVFPTETRALGSGLCFVGMELAILLSSFNFPSLLEQYHICGVFGTFSLIALSTSLLSLYIYPNTKGKTLVAVEQFFSQRRNCKANALVNKI